MLSIVASEQDEQDALKLDLDALVQEGARRVLVAALKAEVVPTTPTIAMWLGMRWWSAMEWRSRGP